MNRTLRVLVVGLTLFSASLPQAHAQSSPNSATKAEPQVEVMSLLPVADAKDEYVILFSNVIYKSLSSPSLRAWLKNFPKGFTIHYSAGCCGFGPDPDRGKPTEEEVSAFASYCKSVGVIFRRSGA